MSQARVRTGRTGERLAAEQLVAWGWRLCATNWRGTGGEIDIVAEDGACLVLVEVRARRSRRFGTAEESIGPVKRRRMAALAEQYVQANHWPGPWRVDVMALDLAADGQVVRLAHYPDALAE